MYSNIESNNILTPQGYIDSLKLINLLKNAKNSEQKDEIIVDVMQQTRSIYISNLEAKEYLASKENIKDIDLKIESLRSETIERIEAFRVESNEKIEAFRAESNEKIESFRNETNERIHKLDLKIENLRSETIERIHKLDLKIEAFQAETNKKIEAFRAETNNNIYKLDLKIEQLRSDTNEKIEQLRTEMAKSFHKHTMWFAGSVFAMISGFAALAGLILTVGVN